MVALTETWLGTTVDKTCIAELGLFGYVMKQTLRRGRKGGGIVLIYKSTPPSENNGFRTIVFLENEWPAFLPITLPSQNTLLL